MINIFSRWVAPHPPVKHPQPGDGYVPPYNYGQYRYVAYGETDLPRRDPGGPLPWTGVPDYRPGLGVTPGLMRSFATGALDALRHPGIVGTDPGQGTDARTIWAPLYTVQQAAIQTALYQRTQH